MASKVGNSKKTVSRKEKTITYIVGTCKKTENKKKKTMASKEENSKKTESKKKKTMASKEENSKKTEIKKKKTMASKEENKKTESKKKKTIMDNEGSSKKTESRKEKTLVNKGGSCKKTECKKEKIIARKEGNSKKTESKKERTLANKEGSKTEHKKDKIMGLSKYTCYTCSKWFISEADLAQHIKWKHEFNCNNNGSVDNVDTDSGNTPDTEQEIADGHVRDLDDTIGLKTNPNDVDVEIELARNTSDVDADSLESKEPTTNIKLSEGCVASPDKETTQKDLYENFKPDIVSFMEEVPKCLCPYCHREFTTKRGVANHIDLWCKEVPYRCVFCKKGLKTPNEKHNHISININRKKGYYVKKSEIKKAYSCSVCGMKFEYKVTLQNHQLSCTEDQQGKKRKSKVACDECGKMICKRSLHIHMLRHKGIKQHTCHICGHSMASPTELERHIESVHKNERKYQCEFCDAKYTQKSALVYHQSVLVGNCKADKSSKAFFKCTLCLRNFTSMRWLARHQKLHTIDESNGIITRPDLACQYCDKKLDSRASLIRHVKIHTKDKQHKCTECEAAFVQKCNLVAHMRIHSGIRPFECHICDKAFNQKSNLNGHLKKHTEEGTSGIKDKGQNRGKKRKTEERECQTMEVKKKKLKPKSTRKTLEIEEPIVYRYVDKGDSFDLIRLQSENHK